MSRQRIVCTGPIDDLASEILSAHADVVVVPRPGEASLVEMLDGAVGIVVRGDGSASARVIERGKHLKVIGRTGTGCDSIDIAAATQRKIPVVYTPGLNARAVAEGAFALILALGKRLSYWDTQLKQGRWESRHQSVSRDLDGATLGIVGLGSCGQILAELARPFNMTLLAYDPYVSRERAAELNVRVVEIEELLMQSQFISIHAPLTDETRGLINGDRIGLLQPGSFLINLARGGLIESLDILHEALQDGTLAGVGLDVFEPEPPDVGHPIFRHPDFLCAPHALALTPGAMGRIYRCMAEGMAAVLRGERPRHVINPEVFE